MNTNNEQGGSQNSNEEDIVLPTKPADDASQEDKDAYYADLEDKNKQLFARAKKAEGFVQKDGKWVTAEKPAEKPAEQEQKPSQSSQLSSMDVFALVNAKIPQEDIQDVVEYATFKKISIGEALTHPLMKTMLADKAEARRVAEGTSTGTSRRGTGKLSDEALLENAAKGIMPETDEGMNRLVELRKSKK